MPLPRDAAPGTPPVPMALGSSAAGTPLKGGHRTPTLSPGPRPLAYAQVREATSPAQVRVIDPSGKASPRISLTPPVPPASPRQGDPGGAAGCPSRAATCWRRPSRT
ncbi:unnamed protein product [Prorocentrum cordatum]|uniref:Uncharacterized protein n=1 Tax=Prorocentrum cordatum TaxID=2364126 RepID=A0ABN9UQ67_9DINO|nr:unnamed protein product [Polarella glacialis]